MQDGHFPRLNAKMFNAPGDQYGVVDGALLSIVGKIDTMTSMIHTADGGSIPFNCEGTEVAPGKIAEAIGILDPQSPNEKRFTLFLARPLGEDFDMDTYNKMIELQKNPKYSKLFGT